ncbi:MAG: isoprenoid biosynthesis glyoxalase ElbB [Desulfobacterales bacterium]|nr:isoprenoid biosynthesis glyoxalase ElbB [Desulfobacterales bacterium]
MDKKVGVILSGCGVYDGSEIHEAVATLVALENHGLEAVCLAPDIDQMHVINHLTGQPVEGEKRNVLVESARIARGNISALSADKLDDLDALIFPGGFGAAKNLSDYALSGPDMKVNNDVINAVKSVHEAGKPIAALCIAPVILAAIFKDQSPNLTLGDDGDNAKNLEQIGGKHHITRFDEVVVDEKLKLITAPCYMLDSTIRQIFKGADLVVEKLKSFLS